MTFSEEFKILIKEWQPLIGSVLTFVSTIAVVATAIFIWRQVKNQERERRNRDYKDSLGARAELPDALSELNDYILECTKYIFALIHSFDDVLPSLPASHRSAMKRIKKAIGAIELENANQIYHIIEQKQIIESRINSDFISNIENKRVVLRNLAYLWSLIARTFPYARRERSQIEKSEVKDDEVRSSLKIILHEANQDTVDRNIAWIMREE